MVVLHWALHESFSMRAVIQRVTEASVTVGGSVCGSIGPGLLVLLGVEETDTREDVEWLAGKIVRLRIFDDSDGVMNRSVLDLGGEVLVVSQFTLLASTRKGNRPSYSRSARPEAAEALYHQFNHRLSQLLGKPLQTGRFGAQMDVKLHNAGPVTILIDSKAKE